MWNTTQSKKPRLRVSIAPRPESAQLIQNTPVVTPPADLISFDAPPTYTPPVDLNPFRQQENDLFFAVPPAPAQVQPPQFATQSAQMIMQGAHINAHSSQRNAETALQAARVAFENIELQDSRPIPRRSSSASLAEDRRFPPCITNGITFEKLHSSPQFNKVYEYFGAQETRNEGDSDLDTLKLALSGTFERLPRSAFTSNEQYRRYKKKHDELLRGIQQLQDTVHQFVDQYR